MRLHALLAVAATWISGVCAAYAQTACVENSCSNDVRGVLGDESISWDVPAGTVSQYEVCTANERACVTTTGTSLLVANTSLDAAGYEGGLKIRACDCHNPDLPCACGGWSNVVEILPYACVNQQSSIPNPHNPLDYTNPACERHCYSASPLRLPSQTPCP